MYQNKLYEEIPDTKVLYCVLTGLSYREIGVKFYGFKTGKFVYQVRKIMKQFNLANRRHLAYFAVKNDLIDRKILMRYLNA